MRQVLSGKQKGQRLLPLPPRGAVIVGPYRYLLWRVWNPTVPRLLWILLNPNTADEERDDPTLRRITGFSRTFGFGGLEVVNLFALRSPDPAALAQARDPIGPENDLTIRAAAARATTVVAAWGNAGTLYGRDHAVLAQLTGPLFCLGLTRSGSPRHPLYLPGTSALCPFCIDLPSILSREELFSRRDTARSRTRLFNRPGYQSHKNVIVYS